MKKEELITEILNNMKENKNQKNIISTLLKEIPQEKYEKILCEIYEMNKKTVVYDENEKQKEVQEIKELFQKIQDGEFCVRGYSVGNGYYMIYDEVEDFYYYPTTELDKVLNNTYRFIKKLIYHKEYKLVLEIANLVLFSNYICEEIGNPEYDTPKEVYDTFEVDINDFKGNLDFNLDEISLCACYSILMIDNQNVCEKIYKYMEICTDKTIEPINYIGVEKIKNWKEFLSAWIDYLKTKEGYTGMLLLEEAKKLQEKLNME